MLCSDVWVKKKRKKERDRYSECALHHLLYIFTVYCMWNVLYYLMWVSAKFFKPSAVWNGFSVYVMCVGICKMSMRVGCKENRNSCFFSCICMCVYLSRGAAQWTCGKWLFFWWCLCVCVYIGCLTISSLYYCRYVTVLRLLLLFVQFSIFSCFFTFCQATGYMFKNELPFSYISINKISFSLVFRSFWAARINEHRFGSESHRKYLSREIQNIRSLLFLCLSLIRSLNFQL